MERERTFIVGDIHGCLGMLKRLMDRIDWRPEKDRLIFLGDYIDRGEDSRGVVDFILGLLETSSLIRCVKGNHEDLFLDFLNGGEFEMFLMNGGVTTMQSYQMEVRKDAPRIIPQDHMAFFKGLHLWVELEDYYLVHAGLRPGVDLQSQSQEDLLWIREPFLHSNHDFGKRVIFGHTPFYEPLVMENKIGLDTGAVYGNKLTCLEIPGMQFHSVEA
jgi:serine/threonine protein phosphatase 1